MPDLLPAHPCLFLFPLLAGFAANSASAFTAAFVRRWGERRGRLATALLRNLFGIPVWASGLVLAARTPAPDLLPAAFPFLEAGSILAALGVAVILWALSSLRLRAAVPSSRDSLVETGPYARVRHPLYDGVLIQLAGLCLILPRWPVLLACALAALWIQVQARLEERDLLERVPGYAAYMARVPRFVPGASLH